MKEKIKKVINVLNTPLGLKKDDKAGEFTTYESKQSDMTASEYELLQQSEKDQEKESVCSESFQDKVKQYLGITTGCMKESELLQIYEDSKTSDFDKADAKQFYSDTCKDLYSLHPDTFESKYGFKCIRDVSESDKLYSTKKDFLTLEDNESRSTQDLDTKVCITCSCKLLSTGKCPRCNILGQNN